MDAIKVWASMLMVIFAANCKSLGQELQFSNYNCAITPPDGWLNISNLSAFPKSQNVIAVLRNQEKNCIITITCDTNRPDRPLDDRMVAEFELGVERGGGGKRVSGKFIEVAGMRGYERIGAVQLKGKQVSTLTRFVPVKTGFYGIGAIVVGGDVYDAPEIWKCMDTFRFLTPPEAPLASSTPKSAAYQTGYFFGQMMVFVVLLFGVITFFGIILGNVTRQKSKGNSVRPPPLPPST